MAIEIRETKDGSHTLYNAELNETYHSMHGALQESEYIYIDQGLNHFHKDNKQKLGPLQEGQSTSSIPLRILEVGFGTGLNAILTYQESKLKNLKVDYVTLEPFPLPLSLVNQLNYPSYFSDSNLKDRFIDFHAFKWEEEIKVSDGFSITKKETKLEDFNTAGRFDIVYFDAFAPSKQADIWEVDNFRKLKMLLSGYGFLITYCSSSQFKKNLQEAGFRIESLPGPHGKREITRAWHPIVL